MIEKRCLGRNCPINKDCAMYVKAQTPREQLFQGYPPGVLCDQFRPIKRDCGLEKIDE